MDLKNLYQVEVRDKTRVRTGIVDSWLKIESVIRFNSFDSYVIDMPQRQAAALFVPGAKVYIYRQGKLLTAGPYLETAKTRNKEAPDGTVSVTGVSFDVAVAQRAAYPVPSSPATTQTASAYDTRTGHSETIIKGYVDANLGPGALSVRQLVGLTIETDATQGTTQTKQARWQQLDTLINEIAALDGLGWRIVPTDPSGLVFVVFTPRDLSGSVRFSWEDGSLGQYQYAIKAPASTRQIIGGQGDLTARTFREVGNPTAETDWDMRIEHFYDKTDTTVVADLDAAGNAQLVTDAPGVDVSVETLDIPKREFGVDWMVGDKVSAAVDGVEHADVIREATVTIDKDGESVKPLVGTADASSTPWPYRELKKMAREVQKAQRKV